MGLRRSISTAFWQDTWVELLTPREKLCFVYLFSCPATNPAGLYKLSLRRIAFETGLSQEESAAALAKFQEDGRILYDPETTVVWVRHFREYHGSESPNWLKGVRAAIEKIPDCAPKRAYLEAWPVGTLPLPLPDEENRSDGGGSPTVVEPRRPSTTLDEPRGRSAKVATRQGQGQGQRQRQGQGQSQGQGQLESRGASATVRTDLADSADSSFPSSDQSDSLGLKPSTEGEKALVRAAIEIRDRSEDQIVTGAEHLQMLRWGRQYGGQALLDACETTRAACPENFGGYLRTVLENEHEASVRDPP